MLSALNQCAAALQIANFSVELVQQKRAQSAFSTAALRNTQHARTHKRTNAQSLRADTHTQTNKLVTLCVCCMHASMRLPQPFTAQSAGHAPCSKWRAKASASLARRNSYLYAIDEAAQLQLSPPQVACLRQRRNALFGRNYTSSCTTIKASNGGCQFFAGFHLTNKQRQLLLLQTSRTTTATTTTHRSRP